MTSQNSWVPCWVRGSELEEIVWIGKDVLAWSTGLCIVFFHTIDLNQSIRWCSSSLNGEGACCLSSHLNLSIFAYSEKTLNPRIIVCEYPSMRKISECTKGCYNGYLTTAFVSHDYFVSLGLYPDFPMILWSWRTGEKIITVETTIRDRLGQLLKITPVGKTLIAQMGKTCGKLFVWKAEIHDKVATLNNNEIKLPKKAVPLWMDWNNDPENAILAITDEHGHVYLTDHHGTDIRMIVLSQRCGSCSIFELPKVIWFHDGIILKTTFCQIRFYARDPKNNETWRKKWYLKSELKPCILINHPFRTDRFFYHTVEGELIQCGFPRTNNEPVINCLLRYGGVYEYIDFVYPWCHHLVVTDHVKRLIVLECYGSGEISSINLDLKKDIACLASHPDYPMIVVTSNDGEVAFVAMSEPELPRILTYIHLQRNPLDFIKFSYSARHMVVAEKKTGTCYILSVLTENPFDVMYELKSEEVISDILLHESSDKILSKIMILTTGKNYRKLLIYQCKNDGELMESNCDIYDLPKSYKNLYNSPDNQQILIGSPHLTRKMNILKYHFDKHSGQDSLIVTETNDVMTGHQVRRAHFYLNRNWIVSFALDGLVIVRDRTGKRIIAAVMLNHRRDLGTKKALVNPAGDLIIALSYNGSLTATRVVRVDRKETKMETYPIDMKIYEKKKSQILTDYETLPETMKIILNDRHKGFSSEENEGLPWTEWWREEKIRQQNIFYSKEVDEIRNQLTLLKEKMSSLLDANEKAPDSDKLEISVFDLNVSNRSKLLLEAEKEREEIHKKLENDRSSMNRVSEWIKINFWDPQIVLGRSIFSISESIEVTNYTMGANSRSHTEDEMQWASYMREFVYKIMEKETFSPWVVYNDEQLQIQLDKDIRIYKENERQYNELLDDDEDIEREIMETEEHRLWQGLTTYRFIEQSPYLFSQLEHYSFAHVTLDNYVLMNDCEKLRNHFNQLFNEFYHSKEREMSILKEKKDKLQHIDSELNVLFGQRVPELPDEPQWHWKEKPETIIIVLDNEIKAKRYISKSQQNLLDQKAAEMERIRQLLLADDFRERALMKMMDGVLEIRWEDTLKLDIPKPECMLKKKPSNYTAEDLGAIKRYEKDVQQLKEEREKYQRILDVDYSKTFCSFQDGVNKFNAKLNEFFQVKMKIESAIHQSNLRYVRGLLRNFHQVQLVKEEDHLEKKIEKMRNNKIALNEKGNLFEEAHEQASIEYSTLCEEEKPLNKKFKSGLQNVGRAIVEILEQQYKRRPKPMTKTISSKDMFDLVEKILQPQKLLYLSPTCKEYLKHLLQMDKTKPESLPPTAEQHHWDYLIRHRRLKISLELKIKAQWTKMEELETIITRIGKDIEDNESQLEELKRKLQEKREEIVLFAQNTELQMVLKMGQVEIAFSGNRDDTKNAILIPRKEIDHINGVILQVGENKLSTLERAIDFRRNKSYKEWEHKCLMIRIQHLKEDLYHLNHVNVTKDIQEYLQRKAQGLTVEKTNVHIEKELLATRRCMENILEKSLKKLENIEKRVKSTHKSNELLDGLITKMNIVRCEMELDRDLTTEENQRDFSERKRRIIVKRSLLIRKLQENYLELLKLQTEHELLRLRRYPTVDPFLLLQDRN